MGWTVGQRDGVELDLYGMQRGVNTSRDSCWHPIAVLVPV
jgi:hypothetical protein